MKEEVRRLRKLENEIKNEWLEANVSVAEPYESAKKLVEHLEAFALYEKEIGVEKIWEDFIKESEDACSHHHSRSRKSKKNKKHKKRVRSTSRSDIENEQIELEKSKRRRSKSRSVSMLIHKRINIGINKLFYSHSAFPELDRQHRKRKTAEEEKEAQEQAARCT